MSKKNELIKQKENIFKFPNLLNNGTIIMILLIYMVLMIGALILFVPKYKYTSVPESSHVTLNQDVSTYLKLSTYLSVDDNGKVTPTNSVTVYFNSNSINETDEEKEDKIKVNYEISGLTNSGAMKYIDSGLKRNEFKSLPFSNTILSNEQTKGGTYKKLFGKILYEIENDEDEPEQKVYEFQETMLTLSKKEKNSEISNKSTIKDVISVSISATKASETSQYNTTTTIYVKIPTKIYHIDYQSWVVTEKGKAYPLVGYYNLYYSERPTLVSSDRIAESLNPKYIIFKAVITNSYGGTQTLFYKEEFKNIAKS